MRRSATFGVLFFAMACGQPEAHLDGARLDGGAESHEDLAALEGPCDGQSCSGHGECAVLAGATARCFCEAGFRVSADGLACTEIVAGDECRGIDCSGHGSCVVIDGEPRAPTCICDAGYHASAGMTECVSDTCTSLPCAEPVIAIDGIVTRLAVGGGHIYAAIGARIVAGPLMGPLTERFDASQQVGALLAEEGGERAYFSTPVGVFRLERSSTTPPSMIFRADALQWLSFDGRSLLCGTAASPTGTANGEASYGHTLRCGSTSGAVERGRITMGGRTAAILGRMGTAFTEEDVFYSVGFAIHRVSKSDIAEQWDPARHRLVPNVLVGDLATDGTYIYWVNEAHDDFAVKRIDISNRAISTLSVLDPANRLPALRVFVHSGYVFWGNQIGVWRVPVTGGSVDLRARAGHLTALARSGDYLYFADQSQQAISRVRLH